MTASALDLYSEYGLDRGPLLVDLDEYTAIVWRMAQTLGVDHSIPTPTTLPLILFGRAIQLKGAHMSTKSVPGAVKTNRDVLEMGCWAEHADGSLIFVEAVEAGTIVYSIFDLAGDTPVEYRDAMSEKGFKERFSHPNDDKLEWTWHDKTPFNWRRVMATFPSGSKHTSAVVQLSAAQRVAESLDLRAGVVRDRQEMHPTEQRAARTIMGRLTDAVQALKKK